MAETTTSVKKTRSKKVAEELAEESTPIPPTTKVSPLKNEVFAQLYKIITQVQEEFERLQKEIAETRQSWLKEQEDHQKQILQKSQEEELARKREEETYLYNLTRQRQLAEDEFADKKADWEKQLKEEQSALEKERLELEQLRKLAANFEAEKESAIKEAQTALEKEMTANFETNRKLREQEVKAEKELANLRITNLTTDNSRQKTEIEVLKKALDEATLQVKEIAVKVIESGSPSPKTASSPVE